MSPPCQPYTRRGRQRDVADPRAAGLLAVIDRIPQLLPPYIALENVPPFRAPQAWRHVGNSLSVVAVRHVLSAIPDLADP